MSAPAYNIPQPEGLTFPEWGARVAEQLAQYGVLAPLEDEDWKGWVCALFYVQPLNTANIPEPGTFTTWQDWTHRFIDCLGVA